MIHPAAQLENIHKTYRMGDETINALNGFSTTFETGSFWAIMGPSGCGKSTLLNVLGCLDRPDSGRYHIDGQNTAELSDNALSDIRLKYLGFIFQSFNLIQQLTVAENIELPLYYLGWHPDRARKRATQLAQEVGLSGRLLHRPYQLSGGQQQRVAIARALANDPVLLLADEPTGNLDSSTGIEIMEMIRGLNQSGKTVIMVTHEPEVASQARHRLVMRDGRIERTETSA
ncbi:MAG: ABC transporter ATP-binding protein [Kiritimatiellia bacterium]